MILWGINALNHDSSIAVFDDQVLVKHLTSPGDTELTQSVVDRALSTGRPSKIYWYENPWRKKLRQMRAKQFVDAFDPAEIPEIYLGQFGLSGIPVVYGDHHRSHAAAGYYCSGFDQAVIFVADAIGELDTVSIWFGQDCTLKKLYSRQYPYSLGLFYSAFTQLLGLRPTKDEYMVTEISESGDSNHTHDLVKPYLQSNLHRGVKDWNHNVNRRDLAAGVQSVFLEELQGYINYAQSLISSNCCIFMGGCAYNAPARKLFKQYYQNTYTMYFPGDAGSSIGAVLANIKVKTPLPDIDSFPPN
jgi:carbamoyltransferase